MSDQGLSNSTRYRREMDDTIHNMAVEWPESMRRNLTHPEARDTVAKHDPVTCWRCQEQSE